MPWTNEIRQTDEKVVTQHLLLSIFHGGYLKLSFYLKYVFMVTAHPLPIKDTLWVTFKTN